MKLWLVLYQNEIIIHRDNVITVIDNGEDP